MSETRRSRGVPLPTVSQWLLIAAVVGVVWLAWSLRHGPDDDTQVAPGQENSMISTFVHLREVEAIARTGRDGVPQLVADLSNENPRVRRNVLLALSQIGPDAEEALSPIRECLGDKDGQVRNYAVTAYQNICRDPVEMTRAVAPLLTDDLPEVRQAAVKTLEAIGRPPVEALIELLQGDPGAIRIPRLRVLRRIGWGDSQLQVEEAVRQLTSEPDIAVRREALLTLAKWGHLKTAEIRDLLRENYADENSVPGRTFPPQGSREAALAAIIKGGPAAAEHLPDVVSLISNGPDIYAFAALRAMKEAARPATADLLRISEQAPMRMRIEIGWTLLEIGADRNDVARLVTPLPVDQIKGGGNNFDAGRLCASAHADEARRQVSRLIPQLTSDKLAAGTSVLYAIWGLAPEAQEAVPALTILLDHSDPWIVTLAAGSLGDIGPAAAPAVPALLAALQRHPPKLDSPVRQAIFTALRKLGPAAKSAVPDLLAELKDPRFLHAPSDSKIRQRQPGPELSIITTLASLGDASPNVIAGLRALLPSDIGGVAVAALDALLRLAPDSPEVLDDVLHWLPPGPVNGRAQIMMGIGQMRGDRKRAVVWLTRELQRKADPEIQKAAAWCLGKIGPIAKAALPVLRELLAAANSQNESRAQLVDHSLFRSPTSTLRQWGDLSLSPLGGDDSRRLAAMSLEEVVREAISAIDFKDEK